jgi:methylmalonyl-CoA/ethylmalonyl-CoA epimerase
MLTEEKIKIKRITEVGVAVKNLDKATYLFVEVLGGNAGRVIEMPQYNMRYRMCRLGKVDFELMEPAGDEGVIARFLKARGEGLHHIGFSVEHLDRAVGYLESKGVEFIGEPLEDSDCDALDFAGREISGSVRFIFSRPSSILGVLFEFIEYPEDYQTP